MDAMKLSPFDYPSVFVSTVGDQLFSKMKGKPWVLSYYAAVTTRGNFQYLREDVLVRHRDSSSPINFLTLKYNDWIDILDVGEQDMSQFSKQDFNHAINTPLKNIREAKQEKYQDCVEVSKHLADVSTLVER